MIPQSVISTLCREQMELPISMKKRSSNLTRIRAEVEHYTSDLPKSATFGTRIQALGNDLGMTPRHYLCKIETDRREARRIKKGDIRTGDTVTCAVCGYSAKTIAHHLMNMHGLTPTDYKDMYGVERVTSGDTGFAVGSGNPAFGHDGALSPWSERFVRGYDADRHAAFKVAQSEFQKTNASNTFRREFYDTDEAYSSSQTRDLAYFVRRYGADEGHSRHALKTKRWISALSAKSEDELNDINSRKIRKSACFYSKAEKDILSELSKTFDDVGFAKSLLSPFTGKRYVYDIHRGTAVIEYDGDFWHMNPEFYSPDFVCPYRGIPASDIWERDVDKTRTAEAHGFTILRIREQDYKRDRLGTIQKCKDFLNQYNENSLTSSP